jgi:hypothetical protein
VFAVLLALTACSAPTAPDPPSIIQQQIARVGGQFVPLTAAQRSGVRISLTQAEQIARNLYGHDITFGFAYLGTYTHTWRPHLPPPPRLPGQPAYVIQVFAPGQASSQRGSWVAINAEDGSSIVPSRSQIEAWATRWPTAADAGQGPRSPSHPASLSTG